MHVTWLSQPPLLVAHSSMSTQLVLPVPVYPLGHAPQVLPPGVLVQVTWLSQPPLLWRTR